ncbi:MAG: NfeD-like protein [Hydrococcus sp. RM1_1_31]|nr:NfeD-like protein [Hydrococcus sp. RM1_1_31]
MNNLLFQIAIISVLIGVFLGILIAITIKVFRKKQEIDSLIRPINMVGALGTVEVPFDSKSRGKVRVNLRGSIVDFTAYTDCPFSFNRGDKVLIVEIKNNRAWVISADDLRSEI